VGNRIGDSTSPRGDAYKGGLIEGKLNLSDRDDHRRPEGRRI